MMPAPWRPRWNGVSYGAYSFVVARGFQHDGTFVNGGQTMLARMSDDWDWQRTYDARQRYFESTVGPLPRDILKIPGSTGIWPRGGLFVIPATRISALLTVYTTFGLTSPDMPLTKGAPVAGRPAAAGYGYEICVVAEPDQQWPLNFLQWAVGAEIHKDVGLLARVEQHGGLTVGKLSVGADRPFNFLIAKARAPWPVGTQLPNGKMDVLVATTITDQELEWSMENGREALLTKLDEAHFGQISLPGRECVIARSTPSVQASEPATIVGANAETIMRDMAAILFRGLVASMGEMSVKHAFADIRRADDDPTMISKVRLVRPDGAIESPPRHAARTPTEVLTLFEELWELRDTAFPDRWYGLTITLFPDGKSEFAFNYDPDCALDDAFFDS
jgi:hypothetical protein